MTDGEEQQPLPANLVVPPQDFAPFDPEDRKRELHPVVSDPSAPGSKRPRAGSARTKATYSTGELKQVQDRAYSKVKCLTQQYGQIKVNPGRMVDALRSAHPDMVSPQLIREAKQFKANLKDVDNVNKEIRTWTLSSMDAATTALDLLATNLQQQSASLMQAITKVRLEVKEGVTEKKRPTAPRWPSAKRPSAPSSRRAPPVMWPSGCSVRRASRQQTSPSILIGRSGWPRMWMTSLMNPSS